MTKPGYKTSEFWLTISTVFGTLALVPIVGLPIWVAAGCAALSTVAYTISRALVKTNGSTKLDEETLAAFIAVATEKREKRN